MEQELISKKELLKRTGISYGQLYRWRRKKLIPEEWFIRKSVFTGQETFFPKDKILARVDKIKNMRNGLSLDELAEMLSPNPMNVTLVKEEIIQRNLISKMVLDYYVKHKGDVERFSFEKILHLYIFESLLQSGDMTLDEGTSLLQLLEEHYPKFAGRNAKLILIRKMGVSSFLLSSSPSELYFEKNTKVVSQLSLAGYIEKLKQKII